MALSVPGGHMAGILAYEATDIDSARYYIDEISKTKPNLSSFFCEKFHSVFLKSFSFHDIFQLLLNQSFFQR